MRYRNYRIKNMLTHWFRRNKKTLSVSSGVSYFVIVLISLTIGFAGYTFAENKFSDITMGYYTNIADRYTDSLKRYFVSFRAMVDEIAESNYLKNQIDDYDTQSIDFAKFLNSKINAQGGIGHIIVVLKDSDTAMTEFGEVKLNMLYNSVFSKCGLDYDSWREKYINNFSYNEWHCEQAYPIGKTIVFSQSVPYKYTDPKNARVKIIVTINASLFETKMIEAGFPGASNLMMYEIHNEALLSGSETNKEIAEEFFSSNSNSEKFYFAENGAILIRGRVEKGNFYWGVELPSTLMWEQSNIVRRVLLSVLVLQLIILMIVIIFFLRKHYSVLIAFAKKIESGGDIKWQYGSSLIENIEEGINATMEKVREYEFVNTRMDNALKKQMIYNMLIGKGGSISQIDFNDTSFYKPHFCVMLLAFPGECEEFDFSDESHIKLFHYAACNIGEEVISDYCDVYAFSITDVTIAFILNLDAMNIYKEDIEKLGEKLIEALRSLSDMEYFVGAGGIKADVNSIADSYQEACRVLEMRRTADEEKFAEFSFPCEFEKVICEKLKSGNVAEIINYINEVIDNRLGAINSSESTVYSMYAEFLQVYQRLRERFGAVDVSWKPLDGNITKDEMKNEVLKYYASLCESIEKNHSGKSEQILQNVIDYIEDNFSDYNLDVNTISAYFGYSRQYIGMLFRVYKQTTTKDFVTQLRIGKAKELIVSAQGYTNEQIALKVGYCSAAAFTRAFKRCEGVTVTQYKERLYQ